MCSCSNLLWKQYCTTGSTDTQAQWHMVMAEKVHMYHICSNCIRMWLHNYNFFLFCAWGHKQAYIHIQRILSCQERTVCGPLTLLPEIRFWSILICEVHCDTSVLKKVNRYNAAIWRGHLHLKQIQGLGFPTFICKEFYGFPVILWNERNLKRFIKIRNLFTFKNTLHDSGFPRCFFLLLPAFDSGILRLSTLIDIGNIYLL